MNVQMHTLSNGLTIVGEPKHTAQSMAAGFFVRTGARDESSTVAGVSHFLEHMMFKGTDRRSPDDVNREFDEIGAHYNAFTSEENTVYFGSVLPEFQPRLVDLLCDMMRPSLRTEDFEVEKNVILEEIALYQDRPQHTVFDILRRVYFGEHALGNSVLGSIQSITDLTRDQMHGYFSRRYVPGNMTFVLVGHYDWDAALRQVEKLCSRWESVDAGRSFAPCKPGTCVHVVTDPKLNRAHLAFAAPGVSAQDPRRRAADVISEVLGGPRGSRLYWALVEPGLADVAQLFHDEEDGSGWFGGYVSCDPANVEEVRERCVNVLTEATTGNIRSDEVARVTRKSAAGHVIRSETPMGRLTAVGFDWIYRKQVESVDQEADATLAVSADDCNALLTERPFENLTTVALGPVAAALTASTIAPDDHGEVRRQEAVGSRR